MSKQTHDDIRQAVRKAYGDIAKSGGGCCGPEQSCCDPSQSCGGEVSGRRPADAAAAIGYSEDDLSAVPEGANMGLGCGNPQAIASLRPGETVLDLGSGGGFDCFLAAEAVGESGHVIGVDMTAEMVTRSREAATKAGVDNVEFRLGEIEHLPVADETADVIISNCVINLSPDKVSTYRDAYRVLKRGGRLAISDVVATAELPEEIKADLALHAGCIAGAATVETLERLLAEVGFENIRIDIKEESREAIRQWLPGRGLEDYIASATIQAEKPA
jgi:SAM-dependent methyltransferase